MAERSAARTMPIKSGRTDTTVISKNGPGASPPGRQAGESIHAEPERSTGIDHIAHYRVIRQLGEGGMGTVFLANDETGDRLVALKIPSSTVNAEMNAIKRLQREGQVGYAINHPNVCQVYEVGEHEGRNYLAMQFIEGCTLAEWLQQTSDIDVDGAVAMVAKIARGVDAAHQAGILHRDLKPGNVMITPDGEPIVTDFGMARWMEAAHTMLTVSGSLIGTPGYMAPEQIMGETDEIGPATDVYSLGVILYELLTGWQPFSGNVATLLGSIVSDPPTPLATHLPGIDPRLEAICLKALAKTPQERFASAGAFADALDEFRTRLPADEAALSDEPLAERSEATTSGRFRRLFKGMFVRKP